MRPLLPQFLQTAVSMIAADFFGVQDDNDSCFNHNHGVNCHGFDVPNLIDQLEAHRISWESLQQSMPSIGFLGSRFPARGPTLYAQKHNPFVDFKDIALDPSRLASTMLAGPRMGSVFDSRAVRDYPHRLQTRARADRRTRDCA
jgi:phosphatidylinositol-3-phosphatase